MVSYARRRAAGRVGWRAALSVMALPGPAAERRFPAIVRRSEKRTKHRHGQRQRRLSLANRPIRGAPRQEISTMNSPHSPTLNLNKSLRNLLRANLGCCPELSINPLYPSVNFELFC